MSEQQVDHAIQKLVVETCYRCSVPFAMPAELKERLLANRGESFWCPNGHQQHYLGTSETDRLKQELESEKRRHAFTRNEVEVQRHQAQLNNRRRLSEKGAKTRLKKRVLAGICPCCSERFPDLAAHAAEKHP